MIIRRVRLTPFRLPLHEPLLTAGALTASREGVLVVLEAHAGLVGVGEAMPLPGFGTETPRETRETLIALAQRLVGEDLRDLDAILDGLERAEPGAPAARAAVDVALHDLAARAAGRSLAGWLARREGRVCRPKVPVNALLPEREPARLAESARRAAAEGFGTLKLKVAFGKLAEDVARLAAVRKAIGPRPRLRIDANGGWKEEAAAAALSRLSAFDLEMVEQPVDAHDVAALARIRGLSPVRVAADEAAAGEARARKVIDLRAADVLCLKLAATGGLRGALRVAARARRAGLDVFVTSGVDGAVGRAAALHLAAALPGMLPACGLATARLLADDLAPAESLRDGILVLPSGPGLGISVAPEALARLATGPCLEFGEGAS